jgi:protein SCO1/2
MKSAFRILFVALLAACTPGDKGFKSTDLSMVEWGGDFTLTAHTGKPLNTLDLRGKVVAIFFGYTHCPDICAPTLAKLALARKQLGVDAKRVQVLFVTVDPKNDTVATLAGFVPKFDPTFIGLTGTEAEIGAVARDYKVAFQANPQATPGHVLIDHFGGTMVRDGKGKLRLMLKNDMPVEDIAHDLRKLARESGRE